MECRHPRDLPQLGTLLDTPEYRDMRTEFGDLMVKAALKEEMADLRERLLQNKATAGLEGLAVTVRRSLDVSYARVINATGTVLHTNLGRAPLGDVLTSVAAELQGYSALEYDLEAGRRGQRGSAAEKRLRWLTHCEAALVVNNCAAAMILLLSAHAKDREVIVSRGELVEIGGGFRIPDILEMSGARLVEVGTTNRTRIADFRGAVTERTAMILTTHSSNFQMVGFTEAPTTEELLALGEECGLPVVYDLGSGMLTKTLENEPSVSDAARFPLSAFSGDKLMGGPQCGVLMGRRGLVEACRRHPLYRALRCDKVTLALLEEVLRRHSVAPQSIPVNAFLTGRADSLQARAQVVLGELKSRSGSLIEAEVLSTQGQVGGGSLPGGVLESFALAVSAPTGRSVTDFHSDLRRGRPALVGRIEQDRLILDFRAIAPDEDPLVIDILARFFT